MLPFSFTLLLVLLLGFLRLDPPTGIGNKAWTLAMDWPGKAAFNAAPDAPWNGPDGKAAGWARRSGNFSFVRVHNAGHMVPLDQPANALEMTNTFLADLPFRG